MSSFTECLPLFSGRFVTERGVFALPCQRIFSHQEWRQQTKPKKGQFVNFSQGHSGTKVQCESCLFSEGKTPEFTKMGEIHELFVLALSLVWFAGATPDFSAVGAATVLSHKCDIPSLLKEDQMMRDNCLREHCVFVKCLVKCDLEFDLKFEISDGINLVKLGGRNFLSARKNEKFRREFRESISGKISETSFQISQLFLGNFVQQKGGGC